MLYFIFPMALGTSVFSLTCEWDWGRDFIHSGIIFGTKICYLQIPSLRWDREPFQLSLSMGTGIGNCFFLFSPMGPGWEGFFPQEWDRTCHPSHPIQLYHKHYAVFNSKQVI